MFRLLTFALAIAALTQTPAFTQTPALTQTPTVTLPPQLDRVLRDYEKAWSAKDAPALAALFADNGFVLARGKPAVNGRAAITQYYQGQGGPLFLRAFAYSADGQTGFILGGYRSAPDGPEIGKFTLTLRKAKGRWLIFSDMDNGNSR